MDQGTRFFVSFSSLDLPFVREIMAALDGQKIDDKKIDFWDYADIIQSIEAGQEIDARLIAEIDRCTHFIAVISPYSMDLQKGRFCRFETEYALKRSSAGGLRLIPVLIRTDNPIRLVYPYDAFNNVFRQELDSTPESIVRFTIKVCQVLDIPYVPPEEAHPNMPFWKLFREEVRNLAYSNREHVDLIRILGEFNEYYKKNELNRAYFLISFFLQSCAYKAPSYQPFYPRIVKAVCETELGMFREAMATYQEAAGIDPGNQDVIGGMGTVFYKLGQYREAEGCFEKIILDTGQKNIRNARINLILTRLAMGRRLSEEESTFLFMLDLSEYADDLKTNILNGRGVNLLAGGDLILLELLCRKIHDDGLHDTITFRLWQLSFQNRGMIAEAREVILLALQEAETNPRLDKKMLREFLKDIKE